MAVARSTLLRDVLFFIKDDLDGEITDPVSSTRPANEKFIMTSYPQRTVQYPLITIKAINVEAPRAGMQTSRLDITLLLEIRIWGRNQKEKDEMYTQILDRLANIQFTATTGSIANNLHDFNVISSVEVDEADGAKSRILQVQYRFFDA